MGEGGISAVERNMGSPKYFGGLTFFLFFLFTQQRRCLTSFVRFRAKLAMTTTKGRGIIN